MKRREIFSKPRGGLAALMSILLMGCVWAPVGGATDTTSRPPALRNGRQLWATVDVCASKPHPLMGIRGSMPPNGPGGGTMYMLFRVQYLNATTKRWTNLSKGGQSGLVKVGPADETRQAGRTFELAVPVHDGAFQLRGIVEFQWRQGSRVLLSATRPTTAGRHSSAGAVPPGFSAATCQVS